MATANSLLLRTGRDGLNDCTVDQIEKLLVLLPIQTKTIRKAELVSEVEGYWLGLGLQQLWNEADAAVSALMYHPLSPAPLMGSQ